MALTGRQKAALLLTSLDAGTATELLKGLRTETVQELAVELAQLEAGGYRNSKQSAEIARQFVNSLRAGKKIHIKSFLNEMLKNTVGEKRAEQIRAQIQNLVQSRDPFNAIRSADSQTIASILVDEHPQAVAVVLSELPARKSSEILGLLGEGIRLSAVSRMTSSESVPAEAKARIAETVCNHLEAIATGAGSALSH